MPRMLLPKLTSAQRRALRLTRPGNKRPHVASLCQSQAESHECEGLRSQQCHWIRS